MKSNQMLAVLKENSAPGVTIKQIPIPQTPKGEVKIKVLHASICGTDVGIYDWTPWVAGHLKPPIVIGHEVVGEILEINGEAPHLKKGDIVSSETHIYDNTCYQCHVNNRHICEHMTFFGYGRNGGFSEYTTIPIHTTWKNDKRIPVESMSIQEPLGNAVHVITKANVAAKKVLIIGLGPTGLCAGMVARVYGASEVVGVNRGEYRRNLAKEIGFDRTLESVPEDEYNTFDVVCEMSGGANAMQLALNAARLTGTVVIFGIPKQDVSLNLGTIINKELTLESVFGRRIWETWYQTSDLLVTGKIDLQKIITHRFKLADFEEAMKVMKSGACGKILLEP